MKPVPMQGLKSGRLYLEVKKDANVGMIVAQPNAKRMVQRFRRSDENGFLVFASITYFELIYKVSEKRFDNHNWFDVTHLFGSDQELKKLNII